MKKAIFFTVLILVFSTLFFSFKSDPREARFQKSVKKIIIDPGHGGSDQGASGSLITEAKLCLQMGLKLGKMLEKEIPDLKVLYTRTTDIIPGNKPNKNEGLRYRAEFANQSGADLFIAIHCNSAPKIKHRVPNGYRWVKRNGKKVKQTIYKTYSTDNPAHGTETFVWAVDRNDEKGHVIKTEEEMNFESGEIDSTIVPPDENDPVIKALRLLYTKRFFKNSVTLADFVEKEFVAGGRYSRGVKQRNEVGIWVLEATGMPSVLVETGFVSDKDEEKYLMSEKGQQEVITSITNAVKKYISWLEVLNGANTQGKKKTPASPYDSKTSAVLTRKDTRTAPK